MYYFSALSGAQGRCEADALVDAPPSTTGSALAGHRATGTASRVLLRRPRARPSRRRIAQCLLRWHHRDLEGLVRMAVARCRTRLCFLELDATQILYEMAVAARSAVSEMDTSEFFYAKGSRRWAGRSWQ